jgi:5-methylcytosine-specific restriction endonuclease McrA
MIPFRSAVPARRGNPSKAPTGDNWAEHKPELRIDFNFKCGYCDSSDGFRHTYFEVDHFIPKDFFKPLGNISVLDYKNLVYSCKFCNNSKRAKWPTKREDLFNDGNEGFEDPAGKLYDTHFYRTADGGILWKTPVGKWMFSEAFQFDKRQGSIRVLWNLSKLKHILDSLIIILNKTDQSSVDYKALKAKIGEYSFEYYLFHRELIEFYG